MTRWSAAPMGASGKCYISREAKKISISSMVLKWRDVHKFVEPLGEKSEKRKRKQNTNLLFFLFVILPL